jgi:hypothetical protein
MLSGADLADLLGVHPSSVTRAVQREGHAGGQPVYEWAVRGPGGRVEGYDVPRDVLADLRENPRAEAEAVQDDDNRSSKTALDAAIGGVEALQDLSGNQIAALAGLGALVLGYLDHRNGATARLKAEGQARSERLRAAGVPDFAQRVDRYASGEGSASVHLHAILDAIFGRPAPEATTQADDAPDLAAPSPAQPPRPQPAPDADGLRFIFNPSDLNQ